MKIFLIASECPPIPGGIATYVQNVTTMFADAGHEMTVFARNNQGGIEQRGNLKFIKIPPKDVHLIASTNISPLSEKHPAFPYNVMGYWAALSYQLAEEVISYIRSHGKPDVIESEDFSGIAYFLIQRKLLGSPELQGVPIVLTLHSCQYMLYPADKMPSYQLSDYWVGRMEKFCTLAADGIIAPTHYIAKQATDALGTDLDIDIIPLPAPKTLLDETQYPKSNPTPRDIVYFGRLEVRKGVIPLFEACSHLWDAGIDFKLTAIGGDTWYHLQGCHVKEYLRDKYSAYINNGRLIISPPLKQTELYERISKAWCVVIPSLWENFPNTCLESMLLGKLILASSDVGHVEMLQHSDRQGGFIFDWKQPEDFGIKLQHILNLSIAENLEIGQKARALISDISGYKNVLNQRVQHFEKVIKASYIKDKNIFPSLNYPPHGKVAYPKFLSVEDREKGIVSVCIPFYNHGAYIRDTLNSVYASDYSNLEVIIFNDGSTDSSSLKVLAEVEKEYSDLTVIHSHNQGVATARNKMAEIARGEYIAFLDSDDKISPSFYSQAVKVLNQYENVGFVASWIKEFGDSQKVWVAWNTEFPYLLCHNTLGVCTVVRKGAYIASGGMKPLLAENLEDYECWISICEQGWLGVVIPDLHYFYRIRSDSRLRNSNRDQLLYLYEVIAALHPNLYREYGEEIYHLLNQNGASWLWDNPSMKVGGVNTDMTGMEILSLVVNKLKRVYGDGGLSLISNRLLRVTKSWLFSKISDQK
ncbi:glycosyltransferase [Nostoc sp. PCC 7524]|uniref:glycosyltransferase n=1 Tax=Nostoc sp. (strain ATCC 29411 / PCC 7524) TaxID=28072 RepID=UPI00029ED76F|nr:glycosyltransferase [Nostoc sp. PCC 7524]AFY48358.1 glycosyltransferase [Nostoc sp. PCC 7524]